ncbi:MAG: PKD domain-containing protein [Candidatus Levyibacteriota bacterium]
MKKLFLFIIPLVALFLVPHSALASGEITINSINGTYVDFTFNEPDNGTNECSEAMPGSVSLWAVPSPDHSYSISMTCDGTLANIPPDGTYFLQWYDVSGNKYSSQTVTVMNGVTQSGTPSYPITINSINGIHINYSTDGVNQCSNADPSSVELRSTEHSVAPISMTCAGTLASVPADGQYFILWTYSDGTIVKSQEVMVTNGIYQNTLNTPIPPIIGTITASPNPVAVNTSTNITANFTDPNTSDSHTAIIDWGDGAGSQSATVTESNGSGSVTGSHTYTTAGVYSVNVTVTDSAGATGSQTYQYISVYNPTPQGLFSAGQKYTSPAGAYAQNTSVTGTVKFGLSYKYQGTVPTGSRQFSLDFNTANLHFNATTVSSLVISNGIGTLTGTGTLTGQSGTYNFLVTGSESANTVRIQITDPANNNAVIYDTQPGAATTAAPTTTVTGNIIAH